MTTAIAIRTTEKRDPITDGIRSGIIEIARVRATVGATIHVPGPAWDIFVGGLTPLTVTAVEPTHIAATDVEGGTWVVWA